MNSDLITEIQPSKSAPLFGFWYPACLSSELPPGSLKGTMLLGLPILVCKTSKGRSRPCATFVPIAGCRCPSAKWKVTVSNVPTMVGNSIRQAVAGEFLRWSKTPIQVDKIGITTYPCRERDGYMWVFVPDPQQPNQIIPDVPPLPLPSSPYRMIHISTLLDCAIDDGIVGLMDPAHGPFVHQSSWWRTKASMHEKAKTFEPIPNGFRMVPHAPSTNSGPYKLLNLFYGGPLTTTIDFVLPNQRFEFVQCGSLFVSSRATVTPIDDQQCRIDFTAAWNCLSWVPFSKTIFRYFANIFMTQDREAMERQAVGLRYKPALMLIDDADTPAKWYYKLKAAHLASVQTGQPLDHPLKERVTLRWKS